MEKVDRLDKKILGILSHNARMPFKDVAAQCGVSRAAIHQRVQHLIENGVITGSGFDVNPKSLGYSTCTYVGLNLERGSMYKKVVERISAIPEVVECHLQLVLIQCLSSYMPKTMSNSWTFLTINYKVLQAWYRLRRLYLLNKALRERYLL